MYEDVTLRIERKKIANGFIAVIKDSNLDKFVVLRIGENNPIILFNVSLLWINNKLSPCTYLVEYTPLFDLNYETEYQIEGPQIFGLKIINPVFRAKQLIGTEVNTGKAVCFSSIIDNPDQARIFQKWKMEYDRIPWNFMYEHNIQFWSSEILIPELKEFQQM